MYTKFKLKLRTAGTFVVFFACYISSNAQNPLITNQYSADPSARVFGDKVYLFPSHDILAKEGKGRVGWFCMEDYHVFSSSDLSQWTDHGMIIHQNKVPWVKPDSYSMWAPDCIYRNGKYYFYFPTSPADTITYGRGFAIGVATADKPEGPYTPQPTPIAGVHGIDPNVFIDKDGQAYLYWSAGNIYGARLKDNMLELASPVDTLGVLPSKGLKEGPYMFERNGLYYLTYPHVENKIERLEYAIANNPLGPFKVAGVIMDESPTGCWTNHHSVIYFKEQWYLFYHDRDYSPRFDKARSVRADSLFFNTDGTIVPVKRTLRGIGITDGANEIQIDRYSAKSDEGIRIDFIDTSNRFIGWQAHFTKAGAWLQYNNVRFKNIKQKTALLKVKTSTGGVISVKTSDGLSLARFTVKPSEDWQMVKAPMQKNAGNISHIILSAETGDEMIVDWVSFR